MTTPPRKRFQIHLSTAIVMMFVAGALIWANAFGRKIETIGISTNDFNFGEEPMHNTLSEFKRSVQGDSWRGNREIEYGWPMALMKSCKKIAVNRDKLDYEYSMGGMNYEFNKWIALNAIVALSILLAVYFLCEWLIRRRAARK